MNLRRLCLCLTVAVLGVAPALAQEVPAPMDLQAFERRAGQVFNPGFLTATGAPLLTATEAILLMAQGIAAVIVIAGLIAKVRKDHVQMEGVAAMILKVAFIATVPLWQTFVLGTADAFSNAVGYHAADKNGDPSPVMKNTWALMGQWVPPGSPYLDALSAQTSTGAPESGKEEAWGMNAWNWARGVGTATDNMFQWLWQTFSGGLRGLTVFLGCALMVCAVSLTLVLSYLSEVLRVFLVQIGFAFSPILIAGLGLDFLRAQAVRGLLTVVAIAFWPVGWAVANLATAALVEGTTTWMTDVVRSALSLNATDTVPAFATAAPYLGWGVLLLFSGITLGLCLWSVGMLVVVPILIGRVAGVGAHSIASQSPEPAPSAAPPAARVTIATSTAGTAVRVSPAPRGPPPRFVGAYASEGRRIPFSGFQRPSSDAQRSSGRS